MPRDSPRDYVVYIVEPAFSPQDEAAIKSQWDTTVDGHAGEKETSAILAHPPGSGAARSNTCGWRGHAARTTQAPARSEHLHGHLVVRGSSQPLLQDGMPAIKEKGEFWLSARARAFAKAVRAIKEDTETKRLQDEFFGMVNRN